jgi:hypothetical protein
MKAFRRLIPLMLVVCSAFATSAAAPSNAAPPAAPAPQATVFDGAMGDVIQVPITTDCPAKDDLKNYTLLVNGDYTGIAAQGCLPGTPGTVSRVSFLLARTMDSAAVANSAAWHRLIGFPWRGDGKSTLREIPLGVSDAHGKAVGVPNVTLRFNWSPTIKLVIACFLVVAVLTLFFVLGARSALLRDVGADASVPWTKRTFSLARTQMAWWTAIIIVSYIYEWVALNLIPTLSAQALALMGIYSVLGVASRGVDLTRQTAFPSTKPSFFVDLISDEGGVAIHRFQMLIFTVTVGVMFLYQVFTNCLMPELDPTILTLIGISGATYIGFKTTEPQPKTETEPPSSDSAKNGYSTGDATS